jgi:hypothetical protein
MLGGTLREGRGRFNVVGWEWDCGKREGKGVVEEMGRGEGRKRKSAAGERMEE